MFSSRDLYIKAGGSTPPPPTTGDFLVRFLDLDGTVLKEEYVDSGNDATAPTNPDYDPTYLEFNQWNQDFTNVTADIDVGAIYKTIDPDKTYLFLRITTATGLQPTIRLNKVNSGTLTIDWGDGTTNTTTSTAGNISITKTAAYSAVGDYVVSIDFSSTFGFQSDIFGAASNYARTAQKIYCGETFRAIIAGNTFQNLPNLSYVSMNQDFAGATNAWQNLFSSCSSIIHVNIPDNGGQSLSGFAVNCYSLRSISVPVTFTFYNSAFANCYSLERIIITGCDWFFTNAGFSNCYSLEKVRYPSTIGTNGIPNNNNLNNSALKEIIVEAGITTIGNSVFSDATALNKFTILGSTLTSIGNNTFLRCRSIESLEFPASLTSIGTLAFGTMTSAKEFVFNSTTPPTLASTNSFNGISLSCKIYVPDANVAAYQAATNWSAWASYIYPLSTRP